MFVILAYDVWELDLYGGKKGNRIYSSKASVQAVIPYNEDILIVQSTGYVVRVNYDNHTVVETYNTGAGRVFQAILIEVIRYQQYKDGNKNNKP